jgi:hypothetical protein
LSVKCWEICDEFEIGRKSTELYTYSLTYNASIGPFCDFINNGSYLFVLDYLSIYFIFSYLLEASTDTSHVFILLPPLWLSSPQLDTFVQFFRQMCGLYFSQFCTDPVCTFVGVDLLDPPIIHIPDHVDLDFAQPVCTVSTVCSTHLSHYSAELRTFMQPNSYNRSGFTADFCSFLPTVCNNYVAFLNHIHTCNVHNSDICTDICSIFINFIHSFIGFQPNTLLPASAPSLPVLQAFFLTQNSKILYWFIQIWPSPITGRPSSCRGWHLLLWGDSFWSHVRSLSIPTLSGFTLQSTYDEGTRQDLQWFIACAHVANGTVTIYKFLHPQTDIFVDASFLAWGGGGGPQHLYRADLTPRPGLSITHWEAINVFVALQVFSDFFRWHRIMIWCDSQVVVAILHSGCGRDHTLHSIARNIHLLQATLDCDLEFSHIPGPHNTVADLLSRWDSTWRPTASLFSLLNSTPVWALSLDSTI